MVCKASRVPVIACSTKMRGPYTYLEVISQNIFTFRLSLICSREDMRILTYPYLKIIYIYMFAKVKYCLITETDFSQLGFICNKRRVHHPTVIFMF
jgi:hypothetical protein